MSERALAAGLDTNCLFVLTVMVLHEGAGEIGRVVWPSQDKIARRTLLSRRTVIRCLQRLERAGLVRVVRHPNGGHANAYVVVDTVGDAPPPTVRVPSRRTATRTRPQSEPMVTAGHHPSSIDAAIDGVPESPPMVTAGHHRAAAVVSGSHVDGDGETPRWCQPDTTMVTGSHPKYPSEVSIEETNEAIRTREPPAAPGAPPPPVAIPSTLSPALAATIARTRAAMDERGPVAPPAPKVEPPALDVPAALAALEKFAVRDDGPPGFVVGEIPPVVAERIAREVLPRHRDRDTWVHLGRYLAHGDHGLKSLPLGPAFVLAPLFGELVAQSSKWSPPRNYQTGDFARLSAKKREAERSRIAALSASPASPPIEPGAPPAQSALALPTAPARPVAPPGFEPAPWQAREQQGKS